MFLKPISLICIWLLFDGIHGIDFIILFVYFSWLLVLRVLYATNKSDYLHLQLDNPVLIKSETHELSAHQHLLKHT